MILSVVIPTFGRADSLHRLLQSIEAQQLIPDEILVVSADPNFFPLSYFQSKFPTLPIRLLRTVPSVCLQRNQGIQQANGKYVFLCDDDIEIPPDYLSKLVTYIESSEDRIIVTGAIQENIQGAFVSQFPVQSMWGLLFRRIFLLSVWWPVDRLQKTGWQGRMVNWLQAYYRSKGNTETAAGWPLVTQFDGDAMRCRFYGLGASVIRREALGSDPFDQVLDRSGIGDNYGIPIKLGGEQKIHVLQNTHALHHREGKQRLQESVSYRRRILALDYFVQQSGGRNVKKRLALFWSIAGNGLLQLSHGSFKMFMASVNVFFTILFLGNPYQHYKNKSKNFCTPGAESGISLRLRLRMWRLAFLRLASLPITAAIAWALGRRKHNNICMFHTGRVGSTVLADMMGQQPDIFWEGELYVRLFWTQKTKTFEKADFEKNKAITFLKKRMIGRWKRYYGLECKFFHLRWLHQDAETFVDALMGLGFDKFIVLERVNYLKVIVSHLAALETGTWHLHRHRHVDKPGFYIDTEHVFFDHEYLPLMDLLDQMDSDLKSIRNILYNRNCEVLELSYERDIESDPLVGYRKTMNFLQLPLGKQKVRFRKTTPFRWDEVVHNSEEIYTLLRNTKYEWMLEERKDQEEHEIAVQGH